MIPTIDIGDEIFVAKFAYRSERPLRGDLVVFHVKSLGRDYIKRVVGLPGDRIAMRDGRLLINGKSAPRRRLADFRTQCGGGFCAAERYEETLPDGRRYDTLDTVKSGPLDNTEIFTVPSDHYFVLGDSRDNSDDSRTEFGYIPYTDIIGRVDIKFYADGHLTWQHPR